MRDKTIRALNQLNVDFYAQIAPEFHQTRQQPWEGWKQLLPILEEHFVGQPTISVLDIGCGNGRFGEFLASHLLNKKIEYTGLDSNEFLLAKAEAKLQPLVASCALQQIDIVNALVENQPWVTDTRTFDLVVAFGIIHHVPSHSLREAFVKQCANLAKPTGIVAIAAWQFDQTNRLIERAINPNLIGIPVSELEENDFILSWERGATAYRYSHLIKPDELQSLVPSDINKSAEFYADGKESKTNHYVLLKRI